MKKLVTGLLVVFLMAAGAAPALSALYKADLVHSSILFGVKHITGIVVGRFAKFDGQMYWDEKSATLKDVKFTIYVDSIDTFVEKRDAHLKSADFFEADKYPVITFESKSEKRDPKDPGLILLSGVLTMKGVSQDVVFKMRFLGEAVSPMDAKMTVAGFRGGIALNRLDFKVGSGKFYTMGLVGKEVEITFNLEMVRAKP
jgi:polyisoprenoid-binding protein YceI